MQKASDLFKNIKRTTTASSVVSSHFAAIQPSTPPNSVQRNQRNRVNNVIAEIVDIPANSISPCNTFADLGADSLDSVGIIMGLEKEFGISISDTDAEKISTVGDVYKALNI